MKDIQSTNESSISKQDLLNRIIAFLKGRQIIDTQKDLAELISINDKNLSSAINGNVRYLTDSLFNKIYTKFPEARNLNEPAFTSQDVQKYVFEKLPIEEKLNLLHKQNLELKEENENLRDMVDNLSLTIEISLAPILRHLKISKDKIPNIQENKSSIN